jgi:hypothetical protein
LNRSISEFDLTAQQKAFVDSFMSGDSDVDILIGPTGAGKSVAASAVISRVLDGGARSVLVMSLTFQVAYLIAARAAHGPAVALPLTREWVWSGPGPDRLPWPESVVAYGSSAAIARPPIDEAIHYRDWDLIVVDVATASGESPLLRSAEMVDWLYNIQRHRHRLLVLLDSSADLSAWEAIPARRTDWALDGGVASMAARAVVPIAYERSAAEQDLYSSREEILERIRWLGLPVDTRRLEDAFDSSALAVHGAATSLSGELRALRNRLAHGLPLEGFEPHPGNADRLGEEAIQIEGLSGQAAALAERAAELTVDSKFEALASFLRNAVVDLAVVLTQSPNTARYITSRLGDADQVIPVDVADLHGSASIGKPAVLVAHDHQLQGLDLRDVDVAIHYDIPADIRRLYVRLSRFGARPVEERPAAAYLIANQGVAPAQQHALTQFLSLVGPTNEPQASS